MNWLYIIVMAYIVLSALRGYHRGFLRVVYSMAALFLTVICLALAVPWTSQTIKTYTPIYQWVEKQSEQYVRAKIHTKLQQGTISDVLDLPGVSLPKSFLDEWMDQSNEAVEEALEVHGVYQKFSTLLANVCMNAIAFLLVLVLVSIIIWKIGDALDLFAKIPGVHIVNRILGFFAGIIKALLVIWLFMLLLQYTRMLPSSAALIRMIEDHAVLRSLYEENRLYLFLEQLKR